MNHLQLGEGSDLPYTEPELINELSISLISVTQNENGGAHVVGMQIIHGADGRAVARRVVVRFAVSSEIVNGFKAWAAGDQERQERKRQPDRDQRSH
jgi:hypothetical protein